MINIHNHYFRDIDVPKHFFGFMVKSIATSKVGKIIAKKGLKIAARVTNNDSLNRLYKVVDISEMSTMEIFEKQRKYYPLNTRFVAIAVDLSNINAGRCRDYELQLEELSELHRVYPETIIPFIHIDPRRKGAYDLFLRYMKRGFQGLKIYPAMGYRPDHPVLRQCYEYCQRKGIPVLAHSGEQSPTHFKSSKRRIKRMLDNDEIYYSDDMNKRELCGQWGHPRLYQGLIEKYKKVNWLFAHMGSETSVRNYLTGDRNLRNQYSMIKHLIKYNDNVYTDISYTLHDTFFWSHLKLTMLDKKKSQRYCFGSDYFLSKAETDEGTWSRDLRAYLGEDIFQQLYVANNESYLKK